MRSLYLKLLLAFLSIVLVTVVVLDLLIGRATTGAFTAYLAGRQTDHMGAMASMMQEFMGSAASQAMLQQMYGPAERTYLVSVTQTLWLAGGVAALAAV